MARAQFSGIVDVSSNPSISVSNINYNDNSVVAAGASVNMRFYAAPGFISEIVNIQIDIPAPAGATTGGHNIIIRTGGDTLVGVMDMMANYNFGLGFSFGKPSYQTTSLAPANEDSGILLLKGQTFDEVDYFEVAYVNNTDQPNNGMRNVRLCLKNTKVAS